MRLCITALIIFLVGCDNKSKYLSNFPENKTLDAALDAARIYKVFNNKKRICYGTTFGKLNYIKDPYNLQKVTPTRNSYIFNEFYSKINYFVNYDYGSRNNIQWTVNLRDERGGPTCLNN